MNPVDIAWIAQLLLILALIYLAYIDWHTFRLPNSVTFSLIFLGITFNTLSELPLTTPTASFIGAFLGYASLRVFNAIYRLLKNRHGIGMGDAKLLAALGAWLGWSAIPSILLIASFAGVIGGIALHLWRGNSLQQAFPFGPFLAIAGIIELLWPQLISTLILSKLI